MLTPHNHYKAMVGFLEPHFVNKTVSVQPSCQEKLLVCASLQTPDTLNVDVSATIGVKTASEVFYQAMVHES